MEREMNGSELAPQRIAQALHDGLITDDGAFVIDMDQRILSWSEGARRILGYRAEEMVGRHCYEAIAGRDPQNHRFCRRHCPIIANARRARPTPNYDVLSSTAEGETKWLNVSTLVLRQDGHPSAVLHLFRDVTNQRRMEETARRTTAALRGVLEQELTPSSAPEAPPPTPMPRLSRRETEVLRALAAGLSTRQIAESLGVRPLTARNHVNRLLVKLGAESRLQAVVYASQHRLI